MRKKKIVAAMLAAAMTVTSFLPAGGLFKPVTAKADGKWYNNLTVVDVVSGNFLKFNTPSGMSTDFSLMEGHTVSLSALVRSEATSLSGITQNSLGSIQQVSVTTSGSTGNGNYGITKENAVSKAAVNIDSSKYGTGAAFGFTLKAGPSFGAVTLKVVSGSASSADTLFEMTGKVMTQAVSLGALKKPTVDTSNNRIVFGGVEDYKYTETKDTAVSETYVSAPALSTLKYDVYKIDLAQINQYKNYFDTVDTTKTTSRASVKNTEAVAESAGSLNKWMPKAGSGLTKVATGASTYFAIPKNTSGAAYLLVTSQSAIKGASVSAIVVQGVSHIANSDKSSTGGNGSTDGNGSTNGNGSGSTDGKSDGSGTTKTTETTKDDGTKTTTTETTDTSGTKTTTTTDTKPDGSVTETTVVENTDGSKTTTVKETNADGSTKESTEVKNADGSSTLKSTETKADGTKTTVDSATTAAGDTKSTEVTTYPAGSAVKTQTTESDVKANGNSVIVVTKENSDNTVVIDSETKNAAGETAVTYEAAAGSSNVTVSDIDTTAKSVTIPAKITAAGKTYKVTKLGAKALKGNKTATKVTVGKNIKNIGKQAFQNASKLKTIKINGNVTTIGKNSFKGIKKNATITIKATKKQYKAMVKKIKKAGGAPAKVTYKRA